MRGLLARGSRHRGFSKVIGLKRELKLSATMTACLGMLSLSGTLMVMVEAIISGVDSQVIRGCEVKC